jgi:hypothetical protein
MIRVRIQVPSQERELPAQLEQSQPGDLETPKITKRKRRLTRPTSLGSSGRALVSEPIDLVDDAVKVGGRVDPNAIR